MLFGSAAGLVTGGTDREALKRAVAGEEPKDGRLEAASGRVRALGAPLEAPFTGRACVAYEYDVKNPTAERSDFAGVALTPCAIDSARGPVRILGWSMLDEFPKALQEEIDRERGLAYLRSTEFEPLGLTNALSFFKNLVTDQDGSIRKDMRIADSKPHLEGRRIEEKVVPVGSTVTVLGIWSEAERGFAPGSSAVHEPSLSGRPVLRTPRPPRQRAEDVRDRARLLHRAPRHPRADVVPRARTLTRSGDRVLSPPLPPASAPRRSTGRA